VEKVEALRSEKEMLNDEYECFKTKYFHLLQEFEADRKVLEQVIRALDDVQTGIETGCRSLENGGNSLGKIRHFSEMKKSALKRLSLHVSNLSGKVVDGIKKREKEILDEEAYCQTARDEVPS
ncbi:MAG: hypothetical protein ACK56I_06710, partial [bacterium]